MIKHLGAMGLARGLQAVGQAVLLILLARDVGPRGFGVIAAFLVVHTFVYWVVQMDTPTYATRKIAIGEVDLAVAAIRLNAILMAVVTVPVVASSALLWAEPMLLLAVASNSVAVWSERVTENRLAIAYGVKRIGPPVITLMVRTLVPLALYLGLVVLGVENLIAFAIARVAAGVASQCLGILLIRLPSVAALPSVRVVLREQAPFATNSAMSGIRTLDSVIVVSLAGATSGGIYSAVARVVSPFNTLAQSILPVLVPRAALASSALVRKTLDGLLVLGLVLSALPLALIPFTESLVVFIFGTEFAGGGPVLFWMLLRSGPMLAAPLMGTALQAKGKDRLVAMNSVATSALLLSAVAIGAIAGGATGAASALAIVSLIRMIVLWVIGRRSLTHEPPT